MCCHILKSIIKKLNLPTCFDRFFILPMLQYHYQLIKITEVIKMIRFSVIQKAKNGDEKAINEILEFYLKKIKKFSNDDEFVQVNLIEVLKGINNFENKKK